MKQSFLLLTAALLLLTGCQNTVNTVRNAETAARRQEVDYRYFSTDDFCRDRLQLIRIDRGTTPSGLLQVQATVHSARYGFWSELWSGLTGENPYHLAYKFDWFDEQGMRVETPASVWLNLILMPGETRFLQAVAPNERCRDFLLSVKEAE